RHATPRVSPARLRGVAAPFVAARRHPDGAGAGAPPQHPQDGAWRAHHAGGPRPIPRETAMRAGEVVSVVAGAIVAVLAWRLAADVALERGLPVGRGRGLPAGAGLPAARYPSAPRP